MNPLLELLAVGIYVAIGILLVVFTYVHRLLYTGRNKRNIMFNVFYKTSGQ